jgi:hypothetical protein
MLNVGERGSGTADINIGIDNNNRTMLTYNGGKFTIGTRYSSTNYFDTLRIQSGLVGIGADAGIWKLYVNGITKINGALEVNGQLAPTSNDTYNLGNSTNKWKNLYVSDDITTATISASGDVSVGGALTGTSATFNSPAGTGVALAVKGGNDIVDNILLNLLNQSGTGVFNIRNNGALYGTAATFSGDVTVSNNSTDVDWSNNSNTVSTGGGGIMVSNQQSLDNTFSSIMWVAKETAGTDQNFAIINQSTAATTYTPKVYLAQRTAANTFTAALTIDESQRVGIGTASPECSLQVEKLTGGTNILISAGNYGTNYGQFELDSISVGLSSGNKVRAITINHSNQYVGINDTTPTYRLDVNGTFRVTGASVLGNISSNLFPSADGTYSMGDNTTRWSEIFTDTLYVTNVIAASQLGSGSSITSKFLRGDNTWQTVSSGSGTVTSVATGAGLSGGPITGSGTIVNTGALTAFTQIQNAAGTVQFSATTATNKLEFQGDGITIGMDATGGTNSVPQLAFSVSTNSVDEGNLKISNAGTNGHFLQKQSGNTGGMTWSKDGSLLESLNGTYISSGTVAAGRLGSGSSITSKFLRGDNTWQTVSSGGDTVTIDATADDILSVSAGDISGVDANTDKLVYWDEGLGKLKYLTFSDLTALP